MPRLPRLHVPGGCYHVILRGNHREDLFSAENDRLVLNTIVAEALATTGARLHAFCWMTNHLHALLQIAEHPLGGLMQRIAVGYSRYRHRQLRTSGHLFERRYRAWLVDVDAYFVTLLHYIHLNPVKARMVNRAEDYRWSSHRAYLGDVEYSWLTLDFGLSLFGSTVDAARRGYRTWMSQAMYASEDRLLEETHPDDPRILGTDRFVATLPALGWVPRSRLSLNEVAAQVCIARQVTLDAVRSSARRKELTLARVDIARRAIEGRVASLHAVARFLNRNPSSLSELLSRYGAH